MKKMACLLLLIQSGFIMAQTKTVMTQFGEKITIHPFANNGLTANNGYIQLGGALIQPSVLTTSLENTLTIEGLQTGSITDQFLSIDANGVLRKVTNTNWDLNGNLGTNAVVNFLGTKDDQPLQFKIDNTNSGKISKTVTAIGYNTLNPLSTGLGNTAVGVSALNVNTSGWSNTAVGFWSLLMNTTGWGNVAYGNQSLRSNTTGGANTAIGSGAMDANTTGDANVGIGNSALSRNISGSYNVGVGWQALTANLGSYNTAIGYKALNSNTIGNGNIAIGANTLAGNLEGTSNIAIGYNALNVNNSASNIAIGSSNLEKTTTGGNNVSIGISSMPKNTTGAENVSMGQQTMYSSTTGSYNTALGSRVLTNLVTGGHNVALGYSAGSFFGTNVSVTNSITSVFIGADSGPGADSQNNQIVIGYASRGRGSNTAQIGNASMTSIGGQVAWSNPSDVRLKKDIQDSSFGLNFINKLRPVTYKMKTGTTDLQTGFIAQEVEAAANSINYKFSGIVQPQNSDDFYSLRYSEFVVPLVKAVQEQQKQIETQQKLLGIKETQILEMEKRLQKLEQKMK